MNLRVPLIPSFRVLRFIDLYEIVSCNALGHIIPIGFHPQKSMEVCFSLPSNCLYTDLSIGCPVKCFDHFLGSRSLGPFLGPSAPF